MHASSFQPKRALKSRCICRKAHDAPAGSNAASRTCAARGTRSAPPYDPGAPAGDGTLAFQCHSKFRLAPLNRVWQAPKEPPRIPHAPRCRRRPMPPTAVLGWLCSGRKSRLRQAARRTPPPRRGPRTCGPRGCVSGGACPGRAAASPPRAASLNRERGRGRGGRGRRGSLAPGAAGAALPGAAGGRWAGRFGPHR